MQEAESVVISVVIRHHINTYDACKKCFVLMAWWGHQRFDCQCQWAVSWWAQGRHARESDDSIHLYALFWDKVSECVQAPGCQSCLQRLYNTLKVACKWPGSFYHVTKFHYGNDVIQSHRHDNVLGFGCGEYYLRLKLGCPDDGTLGIKNDPSASWLGRAGVYLGKVSIPISDKVCITITLKSLRRIGVELKP